MRLILLLFVAIAILAACGFTPHVPGAAVAGFPLALFAGSVLSSLGKLLGGGGSSTTAAPAPPPAKNYTGWIIGGAVAFVGILLAFVFLGARK